MFVSIFCLLVLSLSLAVSTTGYTDRPRAMEKAREKLFGALKGLSAFTKSSIVNDDFKSYAIDPSTRYKQWRSFVSSEA